MCIPLTGLNFSKYYGLKMAFFGLADIPTFFQEKFKIDRTLEYSTLTWLDVIIDGTQGSRNDHEEINCSKF